MFSPMGRTLAEQRLARAVPIGCLGQYETQHAVRVSYRPFHGSEFAPPTPKQAGLLPAAELLSELKQHFFSLQTDSAIVLLKTVNFV